MKKLKILIVFIVILILLILSLLVLSNNDNSYNKQEDIIQENNNNNINPREVTNPHMYLTVKSCIDKYINYIYQEDKESVYRIIDSEYIKKFNITKENVFENIGNIESPVTITVRDMYVLEISESEQEYYVVASMIEESIEGIKIKETDLVVTVKLYINNMIYSIIPNGYGGPLYEKK